MELGYILIIGAALATVLLITIIGLLAKILMSLDETLDVVCSIKDRLEKQENPEESDPIVSVILRAVLAHTNLKNVCDDAAKELEKNIPGYVSECIKSEFAKKPRNISCHQYERILEQCFKNK